MALHIGPQKAPLKSTQFLGNVTVFSLLLLLVTHSYWPPSQRHLARLYVV